MLDLHLSQVGGRALGPEGAGRPGVTRPPSPGPALSCFHWPRGVQACARLQQLLEWTRSAGLGAAGERFFQKLSCTLHLLATPSAQLIQVGGRVVVGVEASVLGVTADISGQDAENSNFC